MMTRLSCIGFCLLLLIGCSAMKPSDYADNEPKLVLEEYFRGQTRAWGMFEDRFGNLRRQFTVDITGRWDGEKLTLDERFLYDDGEREQRVWTLTKTGKTTYEGTAADVIGTAVGEIGGNAFNFRYDLNLKVGDSTWKVAFNDWMFLQPDGVLLNRATVSKFGIELGVVTIAFSKDLAKQAANDRGEAKTAVSAPEDDVSYAEAASQ